MVDIINNKLRELRYKAIPSEKEILKQYESSLKILGYKDAELTGLLDTFYKARTSLPWNERLLLDDLLNLTEANSKNK
jgi:hypothetical protein